MTESMDEQELKIEQLKEEIITLEKKFTKMLEVSKVVRSALDFAMNNLDFFDDDDARKIIFKAQFQYDEFLGDLAPTKKIK